VRVPISRRLGLYSGVVGEKGFAPPMEAGTLHTFVPSSSIWWRTVASVIGNGTSVPISRVTAGRNLSPPYC